MEFGCGIARFVLNMPCICSTAHAKHSKETTNQDTGVGLCQSVLAFFVSMGLLHVVTQHNNAHQVENTRWQNRTNDPVHDYSGFLSKSFMCCQNWPFLLSKQICMPSRTRFTSSLFVHVFCCFHSRGQKCSLLTQCMYFAPELPTSQALF